MWNGRNLGDWSGLKPLSGVRSNQLSYRPERSRIHPATADCKRNHVNVSPSNRCLVMTFWRRSGSSRSQ